MLKNRKKILIIFLVVFSFLLFFVFLLVLTGIFSFLSIVKDLDNWEKILWETFNNNLLTLIGIAFGFSMSFLLYSLFINFKKFKKNESKKETSPWMSENRRVSRRFKKQYNLNQEAGFVINWKGKKNSKHQFFGHPEKHMEIIGSTGSGKSQAFIIPNIYYNAHLSASKRPNMVIVDPKGELLQLTRKYLVKQDYEILNIDFTNPEKSLGWNPLSTIWDMFYSESFSERAKSFGLLKTFIAALRGLDVQNQKDPIWATSATNLLLAAGKFILEMSKCGFGIKKQHFNVWNLARLGTNSKLFKELIKKYKALNIRLENVADEISPVLESSPNTLGSYKAIAAAAASDLVDNELIKSLLLRNEFDVTKFASGDKAKALFINYPDADVVIHPLVSLILGQIYNAAIKFAGKNKDFLDRQLQFIIDEFGILPKISNFSNWINIARSRNIRFCVTLQDHDQLEIKYGKDKKPILNGFNLKVFLASGSWETLEMISKTLGIKKVASISKNISKNKNDISTSESEKDELIMSVAQLQQMNTENYVFFEIGEKPSFLYKNLAWKYLNLQKDIENVDEIAFDAKAFRLDFEKFLEGEGAKTIDETSKYFDDMKNSTLKDNHENKDAGIPINNHFIDEELGEIDE